MLIAAQHLSKTIGSKTLFTDLDIHIAPGEKVALIGRNGEGKTTLLHILGGMDTDFQGDIVKKKNLRTVLTRQEHLTNNTLSALEYVLDSVPHYTEYEKVLSDFEKGHHEDLDRYTIAEEYFSKNGYYYIKDLILATLLDFQISNDTSHNPLATLSGGEKRFVELARMMYSQADLLLIDEPTNHMDYVGKEQFISWMGLTKEGVLVVTHDRDVLDHVDRIIELKNKKISSYKGNYDAYLTQNTAHTTNSVILYQNQLRKLKDAKERVTWGLQMRAKSKAWKIRYDHWAKEYEQIKTETVKPSFWIDQESVENLDSRVTDSYHKFKEKNVNIAIVQDKKRVSELVSLKNISLGYRHPLFENKTFTIGSEGRVFIKGRNGAGKSTLVHTIMAQYRNETPEAKLWNGQIKIGVMTRIGEYEQEIHTQYLSLPLEEAVHTVYEKLGIPANREMVLTTLSRYLFDTKVDTKIHIANLSGGQKARFQLIKMFANTPNLLILDEPTNHLDLPSIEELENALLSYTGGILYISHDTNFIKKLQGEVIEI
jgi:ATP-binding cassette subfamily F protein 3